MTYLNFFEDSLVFMVERSQQIIISILYNRKRKYTFYFNAFHNNKLLHSMKYTLHINGDILKVKRHSDKWKRQCFNVYFLLLFMI